MIERNNAQNEAAASQNNIDWQKYKMLRNEVTKRLKHEQKAWQKVQLLNCDGRPSDQWQHILGWLGWKDCGSPQLSCTLLATSSKNLLK